MSDRQLLIPFRSNLLPQIFCDTVVVGSGVAGLRTAIGLGDRSDVILLAKEALDLSNTSWAQGGIAAAVAPDDTIDGHVNDTLEAGAGLCEPDAVRVLVQQGADEVRRLLGWGMRVDRDKAGAPALGLEGGHHHHRILHTDGDATGTELARCLIERARALPPRRHRLVGCGRGQVVGQGLHALAPPELWRRALQVQAQRRRLQCDHALVDAL